MFMSAIPPTFCCFLWDASKTPESPATDSSLTAADTERVFVPDEVGVSEMGDKGGSSGARLPQDAGRPKPDPWDILPLRDTKSASGMALGGLGGGAGGAAGAAQGAAHEGEGAAPTPQQFTTQFT